MRTPSAAVLVLLVLVTALRAADLAGLDTELKKTWPNNRTINIVFHGHSVPAGYHRTPLVKPFESYPHLFRVLLNERYPYAVVNVITTAIGGENSLAGAQRFAADVLARKPDLVFIDYGLNDRSQPLPAVEAAWRSMVDAAQAADVPVVLVTPTGASNADLADPADPLSERAALIRGVAGGKGVLLADVSAAWLRALQGGTAEADLLSQVNHPNLAGHRLAAEALFATFSVATGAVTTRAAEFPRDKSTGSFTTADSQLAFTTTHAFSGQNDFLGDSGGSANRIEAFDGDESLRIVLKPGARLHGFGLRYTEAAITISGFASDPGARVGTVNEAPGTVAWDAAAKTLTLGIPWDDNRRRHVTFTQPAASDGRTLTLAFANNGARVHQATFTDFTHQIALP